MSQPNDCTHCAEWEICPFHPKPQALAEPCESDDWGDPDDPSNPFAFHAGPPTAPINADITVDWPLRLLGPDDPEVSSDLIYLNEATGGVVGVPSMRACVDAALDRAVREGLVTPGLTIGGLHLERGAFLTHEISAVSGRFSVALPLGSEREAELNAMYQADRLCTHRVPFVALDVPAAHFRTYYAWFESRQVGVAAVTYNLRFA